MEYIQLKTDKTETLGLTWIVKMPGTLYGKKFMTFIGKADDVSWIKTNASAKRFNLEKPKEKT